MSVKIWQCRVHASCCGPVWGLSPNLVESLIKHAELCLLDTMRVWRCCVLQCQPHCPGWQQGRKLWAEVGSREKLLGLWVDGHLHQKVFVSLQVTGCEFFLLIKLFLCVLGMPHSSYCIVQEHVYCTHGSLPHQLISRTNFGISGDIMGNFKGLTGDFILMFLK